MRQSLKNERGNTLLTTLAGVIAFVMIVTIYFQYTATKDRHTIKKKEENVLHNVAVTQLEEGHQKVKETGWEYTLPFTETREEENYTVKTTYTKEDIQGKTYLKGDLIHIRTEVTNGRKTKELSTYVFGE